MGNKLRIYVNMGIIPLILPIIMFPDIQPFDFVSMFKDPIVVGELI